MKKQSKQLLILVIILALLCVAVLALKQFNKSQSETGAYNVETGETIVDAAKEDVVKISYDYEGEDYTYEKEEDTWYYAQDHSVDITQYLISNMAGMVAPLQAEQVIEGVTDMAQYGLAEPTRTISFETENASYIFEVGDYNSISSVYYIRKPSDDTVYAVNSGVVTIFNKTLEDVVSSTDDSEEAGATTETTETEETGATTETEETGTTTEIDETVGTDE